MINAIYKITFRGAVDWGIGILIFKGGVITGVDIGGALYDGEYSEKDGFLHVKMNMKVPPGVTLVQGTLPSPNEYVVEIDEMVKITDLEASNPIFFNLKPGPVNVIFQHLRDI